MERRQHEGAPPDRRRHRHAHYLYHRHRLRHLSQGRRRRTLNARTFRLNSMTHKIEQTYTLARERYADLGVDTEVAIERLATIPISLHCWQGDDVGGFESAGAQLSGGGIQATGHYPGKARSLDELRSDLDQVFALLPGRHRLNLHAIYGDFGGKKVERDAITPAHFQSWMD